MFGHQPTETFEQRVIWDLVDFSVLVMFDSYISLACDPMCASVALRNAMQLMRLSPKMDLHLGAPPLLSSRIDFEVHIIWWQSVQGGQISALTRVHVVVTKQNMWGLVWDPAHSIMLSGGFMPRRAAYQQWWWRGLRCEHCLQRERGVDYVFCFA